MFFFFTATPPTEICPLSLHDALPIFVAALTGFPAGRVVDRFGTRRATLVGLGGIAASALVLSLRSEEHTSELQSRFDLVCRLLLEKKKKSKTCFHSVQLFVSKITVIS